MLLRRWLCSCAIIAGLAGAAIAEDLNVQVRQTPVREKPNPLANVLGNLNYGDQVTVLEKLGAGWRRVEHKAPSKLAGWVRTSALTAKSLNTSKALGGTTQATTAEASEAGRGLLEKGEESYVTKNNLQNAMAQVDALVNNARLRVTPAEVHAFLTEGGVTPKGGN